MILGAVTHGPFLFFNNNIFYICRLNLLLIMKRIFLLATVLIASATACTKHESPKISVDPQTAVIGYQGRTIKTPVESNSPWTATSSTEGVMIAPSAYKGNCRVSITVPSSAIKEERDIRVVFRLDASPSDSSVFTIRQDAIPFIEFENPTDTIPGEGGTIRPLLKCNGEWELITASVLSQCTLTPTEGNGTMNIEITMPPTTKSRVWSISPTFARKDNPDLKATLKVVQKKKLQ